MHFLMNMISLMDDHIAAIGDAFTKNNTEFYRLNYIDLETGKAKVYPEYGDIKGCWTYQCDNEEKAARNRESYNKTKEGNSFKTGRRCSYNAD